MQVQKSSKPSDPKPDEPQRKCIEAADEVASEAQSSDAAGEGTNTGLILPDLHPDVLAREPRAAAPTLIYALLALAAHAGLWYATLPYRQSHLVGKGGIEDKAINVEIVSLKGLFAAGAYSPRAKVASSAKERKLDSDLGGEDEIAAADAGKRRRDRDKEQSETVQQKPRSDPIGEARDKDRRAAVEVPAAVPRPPAEPQTQRPPEVNPSPTPAH